MNTCNKCPYSVANVEEQYDRIDVWYECELCEGGCNKGERLKDCPLQAESEEEE